MRGRVLERRERGGEGEREREREREREVYVGSIDELKSLQVGMRYLHYHSHLAMKMSYLKNSSTPTYPSKKKTTELWGKIIGERNTRVQFAVVQQERAYSRQVPSIRPYVWQRGKGGP